MSHDFDNFWGIDEAEPLLPVRQRLLDAIGWCRELADYLGLEGLYETGKGDHCVVLSDPKKSLAFKIRPSCIPDDWHGNSGYHEPGCQPPPVFEAFPWWQYQTGLTIDAHAVVKFENRPAGTKSAVYVFICPYQQHAPMNLDAEKLARLEGRLQEIGADTDRSDIKPLNQTELNGEYFFLDGGAIRLPIINQTGDNRNDQRMALAKWQANPRRSSREDVGEILLNRKEKDKLLLRGISAFMRGHQGRDGNNGIAYKYCPF
jgi:hypothetical protein